MNRYVTWQCVYTVLDMDNLRGSVEVRRFPLRYMADFPFESVEIVEIRRCNSAQNKAAVLKHTIVDATASQ